MPDTWELEFGLNPLEDDAADDPDGDDISNINEYNLGINPNHFEGNLEPEAPVLLSPENSVKVSLTPLLETGDFIDWNINDVHSKTQWNIMRAFDDVCVFDVTTTASLTAIDIPRQILEEDTEYIWQVRFIDSHDALSEWSGEREFITDIAVNDSDGNGVPDDQEVSETLDLDGDGTTDTPTAMGCRMIRKSLKHWISMETVRRMFPSPTSSVSVWKTGLPRFVSASAMLKMRFPSFHWKQKILITLSFFLK
jgi:hypothetical protein